MKLIAHFIILFISCNSIAQDVVINTELSGAAYDEYQKNPDDTHRLFYVACTRTENNLFIIEPQRKKAYDI